MGTPSNILYKKPEIADRLSYGTLISHGLIPGASPNVKFGYNDDLDSAAEETIWAPGGMWTPPSEAEILTLTCDNVNDTLLGTGARQVYIFGLDADHNEIVDIVDLNGGSVDSNLSFIAVNRAAVSFFGTNQKNFGDIDIVQKTSGLTLGQIPAGAGITQQLIYTVPAGKTGYLKKYKMNAVRPSGSDPNVGFTLWSYNPASNGHYNILSPMIDCSRQNEDQDEQEVSNPSGEKTTLYWTATTNNNNTRVFGRFTMEILQNFNKS